MSTEIKSKHAYDIIKNCIVQLQQRKKQLYDLLDIFEGTENGEIIQSELDKINIVIKFLNK